MEEYHSIVIVGAGISGLYASRILSKLHKDVIVVEAQETVGGRIKQIDGHAPWPVEVGPEFIHGATSVFVDLIKDLGFSSVERNWPDWWYFGREKRLIHDTVGDDDLETVHEMFDTVEFAVSPPPGQPDVSAREWLKAKGATDKMIAIADACYANDFGCSIDQLGLREMIEENRRWDSGETYLMLDRSLREVVDALTKTAKVKTSWPVTKIQYTSSGAVLTGPGGAKIRCAKVIVTVPLPVLQKGKIQFSPPLPAAKEAALQRLKMGNAVKVILSFDRRFWPENMYDIVCIDCFVPELWMTSYRPTDPASSHLNCIVGFIAGQNADAAALRPDQTNIDGFLRQLDEIFGTATDPKPATSSLAKATVVDWSKQQWVGGAYTYPSLGAELGDRDLIAAPLEDTVFFSGEATHPSVNPCMQAAMETAKRASMQLCLSLQPKISRL